MKKVVKFLLEVIIFTIILFAILLTIGILMSVLEKIPLLILIVGLFLLIILGTILEFK